MVVTCVVHYLGSVETCVPFVYLGHIALACIFFPRRHSLLVALLAFVLYATCLGLEFGGALEPTSIFAPRGVRPALEGHLSLLIANADSVLAIWLAIWYLTSRLSILLLQRDAQLAETNRKLVAAQEERARSPRHALRQPAGQCRHLFP
jgi:hypothetical protein